MTTLTDPTIPAVQGPESIPPLPENATPEQKDEHWFKYYYRGDKMPQLTLRAVLMGGVLGMLMAASNLYTTLAIGWAFGVAITACVMSFVIWNGFRALSGGRLSEMSILENNCMQSTASAAGYSTGSTIATMFGAMLLLAQPGPGQTSADVKSWAVTNWWVVGAFTFCTGLMGVFLAIPLKRQMINQEQLRFPSGVAAAEMLESLHSKSRDAIKKAYVLIVGIATGGLVGFFNTDDGTAAKVGFMKRFFDWTQAHFVRLQLPGEVPDGGIFKIAGKQLNGFVFEPSLLLIAAGIITGMRVCLSMFAGSVLLYFVVGPALVNVDMHNAPASGWSQDTNGAWVYDVRTKAPGYKTNIELNVDSQINREAVAKDPSRYLDDPKKPIKYTGDTLRMTTWALWGGTAVMVFASLASLALQWKTVARAFTGLAGGGSKGSSELSQIEVPVWWMVAGMVPITIAMLAVQIVAFKISIYAGLIAVVMSFFLSLVACRATGETDTTPIGAMGKVMQLLFALLHPGKIVPNLAAAGIAANSASSSADLLTDLKSGYLLGANPRKQFLAQFFGVFFGTIAIVPIWFLMVPDKEQLEKFAAPATRQWEAVAKVLTKGIDQLPDSAKWAILIGALVGIGLPVLERFTPAKYRKYLPSAMGLGLSWVIPFSSAIGFMLGAIVGWVWKLAHKPTSEKYSIGLACGWIAGESLMKAFLAMTATAIFLMTPKSSGTPATPPAATTPAPATTPASASPPATNP